MLKVADVVEIIKDNDKNYGKVGLILYIDLRGFRVSFTEGGTESYKYKDLKFLYSKKLP